MTRIIDFHHPTPALSRSAGGLVVNKRCYARERDAAFVVPGAAAQHTPGAFDYHLLILSSRNG